MERLGASSIANPTSFQTRIRGHKLDDATHWLLPQKDKRISRRSSRRLLSRNDQLGFQEYVHPKIREEPEKTVVSFCNYPAS